MDARDIMTRDVVAVSPDMAIGEAVDVLMHYQIHGAPVVDNGRQLIGMISFTDLASGRGNRVRDIMASDPVYASEDTPVEEIAAAMLDQAVRRVPIIEGGRVLGIVSASDIVRAFLQRTPARATAARPRKLAAPRGTRHARVCVRRRGVGAMPR